MADNGNKTVESMIKTADFKHFTATEQYVRAVTLLFNKCSEQIAAIAAAKAVPGTEPFKFSDFPAIKARVDKLLKALAANMTVVIQSGDKSEWMAACKKNDQYIREIMDTTKLTKARLEQMQERNLDALKTFQGRKIDGMDLSQRVWNYVGQYRDQMELAIDAGLGDGTDAAKLAREVKQYLVNPDMLFRRVRDKHGVLQLSKAAKAFHPGRGVYRSSVKNAQRLTRSEINMAYRESDRARWEQMDFVAGYEVKRSNWRDASGKEFECPICERLQGRYPKWFRFKGWHPQCRCYVTPILADEETFNSNELEDLKAALYGRKSKRQAAKNTVTDVPEAFKEWAAENAGKQAGWASSPYFVRDNFIDGDISKGLNYPETKPTPLQIAEQRHAQRTPEQIKAIKDAWQFRADALDGARKALKEWEGFPESFTQELAKLMKTARYADVMKEIAKMDALKQGIISNAKDMKGKLALISDIDTGKLADALKDGNLKAMQDETDALHHYTQEIEALDLIDDPYTVAKTFSLKDAVATNDAVKAKLKYLSGMPLSKQLEKLKFEIDWVEKQKKYPTWQVAQDAYKKEFKKVEDEIMWEYIKDQLADLKTFSTKSKVFYQQLDLLQQHIGNKDLNAAKHVLNAAKTQKAKIEAAAYKKAYMAGKTTAGAGGKFVYDDANYTQERKDKAVWDTGDGSLAAKTLRDSASHDWLAATEAEKDRIYEYTRHYCNINEPLTLRQYLNRQSKADFIDRVTKIQSYIDRSSLPKDMWFQRGETGGITVIESLLKFAGENITYSDIKANPQCLVGKTLMQGGFMSVGSQKGHGFSAEVILNIYAPKGTKATYVEPFSHYGNGGGRAWDGHQIYSSFSREHETLFQRGTQMRITKVEYTQGCYYIDVEVIGQELKDLSYVPDSYIGL